jgi:hypothetical protein
MADQNIGFLEGAPGNASAGRLISVTCVFAGIALLIACSVIATVRATALDAQIVIGALGLVGLGVGGKVGQSLVEHKGA